MSEPDTPPNPAASPNPEAPQSPDPVIRYLHERKPILRARALTVLATLVILLILLAAWRYHTHWRLGRIILTNQGIPLLAQLFPETGDEPLGEPFDVVARSTLDLPPGDYRLRVNGVGRLGRTYRFAVNPSETMTHELSLDDGHISAGDADRANQAGRGDRPREEPTPYAPLTKALELTPGKFDIVELNGRTVLIGPDGGTVLRRDPATGKPVWKTPDPNVPHAPSRDPGPWLRRFGQNVVGIHVVEPAFDCNGDGIRDILLAVAGFGNGFIALSGQNGSMLWNFSADMDGPGGPLETRPSSPGQSTTPDRQTLLIGSPAIGDVNADGTPDLIATLVFHELPAEIQKRTGRPPSPATRAFDRRVIQAISGRSGRSLWSFPLDQALTLVNVAYVAKPAVFIRGKRSARVAILDGRNMILLDAATGQTQSTPFDLNIDPIRHLLYADLTGDGEPEILALGPGGSPSRRSLTAFSLDTGQRLWKTPIAASYPLLHEGVRPEWPWLIDLDSDGQTEVIVPDSGPLPPKAAYRGLRVLDGSSGQTRWIRPIAPETIAQDGVENLVVAPDSDGDGFRELVTVSRFDGRNPPAARTGPRTEPQQIYVDALSGRDGHPLWHWHVDLPEAKVTAIRPPKWWGRGPDGWPLLAIPLGGRKPGWEAAPTNSSDLNPPVVHVLEASTGRELHQVMGLTRIGAADLDGDGLLDLWGSAGGELRSVRGKTPELWRTVAPSGPAPGLARDDPRWTRDLPWTNLVAPHTLRTGLLAVIGLALLNVFLPLGILCLVARRRPWNLRVLMALPVVAAVPLTVFLAVERLLPVRAPSAPLPTSPQALFILGSAAGVPLIAYVIFLAAFLLRRRWRTVVFLIGFTLLASFLIAAIWLGFDMRTMPSIERYSRTGWELPLLPGASLVSVGLMMIWITRQTYLWITRRATRPG